MGLESEGGRVPLPSPRGGGGRVEDGAHTAFSFLIVLAMLPITCLLEPLLFTAVPFAFYFLSQSSSTPSRLRWRLSWKRRRSMRGARRPFRSKSSIRESRSSRLSECSRSCSESHLADLAFHIPLVHLGVAEACSHNCADAFGWRSS